MTNLRECKGRLKAIFSAAAIVLTFSTVALASEATLIRLKMADFFRLDSDHAWALVNNGSSKNVLFQTSDGGANWVAFPSPFSLQHVFFIDANNGWAIAEEHYGRTIHTFCVRTSDSGRTWNRHGPFGTSEETATGIALSPMNMVGLWEKATLDVLLCTKLATVENTGANWLGILNQPRPFTVYASMTEQPLHGLLARVAAASSSFVPAFGLSGPPSWRR